MRRITIATLIALPLAGAAAPAMAGDFSCKPAPPAVVSLDFGSRYTAESETRSDLDEASNAEVNKALKPVEEFVGDLSRLANAAMLEETDRAERVACATAMLLSWADADALTGLDSMNARLAAPARFAGLALALLQLDSAGGVEPDHRRRIAAWLHALGTDMVAFFDEEAPPRASRNNLRAWAALAAAAVGKATDDAAMLAWARTSFELVACDAAPDGSLPLEMGRAERALSYQLHAVGPLVVTAELLSTQGYDGYAACNGKLRDIAGFSLRGLADPALVEAINGKRQTFAIGRQKVEPFMLAWVEPYLARHPDQGFEAYVDRYRPLSHSKLGGNLTALHAWLGSLGADG